MSELQLTYVEMCMVNSMISWSYSKSVVIFHIQIICFWEIMLIEDITLWKQFAYFYR